jgi:carboxyl-terminal processing protease
MNQPANNRRWTPWMPLLLAVMLVTGIMIGMELHSDGPVLTFADEETLAAYGLGHGKIDELLRYIEAKYVDSVDRETLIQEAIDEVLGELDPHSNYMPADRVREEAERLEGNFEGIGVEFMLLDDTIRVVAPIPGGPSEKAGILAGDNIITIEDTLVAGVKMETTEIMRRLRGPKDSKVRVGVLRQGEKELRKLEITRDRIPVESVDAAYMISAGIGYIRINRFSATTAQEFNTYVRDMVEKEGLKDLIVDLRQNPGGYLREATEILSQFFPERGKLLVYTQGRTSQRQDYETTGRALFNLGNIAILIDEGSASASEILAGAVQDNDRGVIVGRRSYGKGLVQEQYQLSDGSALRLTVARYYIPSGRSIQRPYDDRFAYEHDLAERQENGEFFSPDSLRNRQDTIPYYTSGGRKVYGGGGITPDVFVPLDSAYQNEAVIELQTQVPAFVFKHLHQFQAQYKGLDIEQFRQQFQGSDQLFEDLISYAAAKGVKVKTEEAGTGKKEIIHLLKARIAKQLFDNEGFFVVLNERDGDVQKALEILRKPDPLSVLDK